MDNEIQLQRRDVPAGLIAGYRGRKLRVIPSKTYTVEVDAGLWSGGSRTTVDAYDLATGSTLRPSFQSEAPWGEERGELLKAVRSGSSLRVPIPPGVVIRERIMFCGKDLGFRFYANADDLQKLLPRQ